MPPKRKPKKVKAAQKQKQKQTQSVRQNVIVYAGAPPRKRGPTRSRAPRGQSPSGPTPDILATSLAPLPFYRINGPIQPVGESIPIQQVGPTANAHTQQEGLTSNMEQRLLELHSKIGTLQGGLKTATNLLVAQNEEIDELRDRGVKIEEVPETPIRRAIDFEEKKQEPDAKKKARSEYMKEYRKRVPKTPLPGAPSYKKAIQNFQEEKQGSMALKRKGFEALKKLVARKKDIASQLV